MTKQQIAELIQAVTVERDAFVQQANQQIAFLNGRLQALGDVLAQMDEPGGAQDGAVQDTEEKARA